MWSGSWERTGWALTMACSHSNSSLISRPLFKPWFASSNSEIRSKASWRLIWGQPLCCETFKSPRSGCRMESFPSFHAISHPRTSARGPIGTIGSTIGSGEIIALPGDIFNWILLPSAKETPTTGKPAVTSPFFCGRRGCVAPESMRPAWSPVAIFWSLRTFCFCLREFNCCWSLSIKSSFPSESLADPELAEDADEDGAPEMLFSTLLASSIKSFIAESCVDAAASSDSFLPPTFSSSVFSCFAFGADFSGEVEDDFGRVQLGAKCCELPHT